MPSNKELKAAIIETAEALGVEAPDTDGMNNATLVETLSALKKPAEAEVEVEAEVEAEAEVEVEAEATGPVVGKGKAITTKRGTLGEGCSISPKDLSGGEEAFAILVEKGYVVE